MNILLVGACGVGKTWVMNQVLKENTLWPGKIGKFKFHYNDSIVVLGVYDGSTFQGSDRLSMSVLTDLDKFLAWSRNKTIICEGDRFTNSTFINKAHPFIIKIKGDGEAGRKIRGSKQTERHIKSIATRVSNIKENIVKNDSEEAYRFIKTLIEDDK